MKTLVVKKDDLPMPLIVQDRNGQEAIYELAPASTGKLGAYLRGLGESVKQMIRELRAKN